MFSGFLSPPPPWKFNIIIVKMPNESSLCIILYNFIWISFIQKTYLSFLEGDDAYLRWWFMRGSSRNSFGGWGGGGVRGIHVILFSRGSEAYFRKFYYVSLINLIFFFILSHPTGKLFTSKISIPQENDNS